MSQGTETNVDPNVPGRRKMSGGPDMTDTSNRKEKDKTKNFDPDRRFTVNKQGNVQGAGQEQPQPPATENVPADPQTGVPVSGGPQTEVPASGQPQIIETSNGQVQQLSQPEHPNQIPAVNQGGVQTPAENSIAAKSQGETTESDQSDMSTSMQSSINEAVNANQGEANMQLMQQQISDRLKNLNIAAEPQSQTTESVPPDM